MNDLHLLLPTSNEDTVKDVWKPCRAQKAEIFDRLFGEVPVREKLETLTVLAKKKKENINSGQMTLFDVFSGQNKGEQQSTGTATEPAGDLTPTAQPQATGVEAQQAETAEQSQAQPSTDTTVPAQSASVTPQSSGTATPSENN